MDMENENALGQVSTVGLQNEAEEDKEPDAAEVALVTEWIKKVNEAKSHWDTDFKRMKKNMKFSRGLQWPDQKDIEHSQYVANLTLRQIQQGVAAVYAKNPTFVAKRKPKQDFLIWDETQQTLIQAMQAQQAAQQSGDEAMMQQVMEQVAPLLQDVENGKKKRAMMDKISKSLELVMNYSINEVIPRFKTSAKQLVRRVKACGVGYIKLSYQRQMEQLPEITSKIADITAQLDAIKRLSEEMQEGEIQSTDADAETLKIMLEQLQAKENIIAREGLVFSFPKATSIIVSKDCTQLNGFIDASFIAEEYFLPAEKVEEIYGVDVCDSAITYASSDKISTDTPKTSNEADGNVRVLEIYDLKNNIMFVVCEGYKGFLKRGDAYIDIEQFHPYFTLCFNELEDDSTIYPPSDVDLMRDMQLEYNRAREGLREHRQANKPAHVAAKGLFPESDLKKFGNHSSHEIIELDAIPATGDVDIRTKLMPKPTNPIDPQLYDTEFVFADILRVSGNQEANIGGTSGASATEVTEASQSRVTTLQSNIDDMDEMFTDLARACSQVLLKEMNIQTVKKIAGDGAMWPEFSGEEIAEEIYLDVKAGSSGRPNKAMQIANMERLMPYMLQIPNLDPMWLLRQLVEKLDDTIDIDDAILDGMPSIMAQNGNMQAGANGNNPNNQGAEGKNNQPNNSAGQPVRTQSQPSYNAAT